MHFAMPDGFVIPLRPGKWFQKMTATRSYEQYLPQFPRGTLTQQVCIDSRATSIVWAAHCDTWFCLVTCNSKPLMANTTIVELASRPFC